MGLGVKRVPEEESAGAIFLLPCLVGLAHHDTTRCTPSLASCPRASLLGRPCWTSTDSLSRFLAAFSPLLDDFTRYSGVCCPTRSRQPPSSPRNGAAATPSSSTLAHRPSSPSGPSRHSHNPGSNAQGRRYPRATPGGEFDRSMPVNVTKRPPVQSEYDRSMPVKRDPTPSTSSSSMPAPPPAYSVNSRGDAARQLFDPRLHDPMRFVSPRGASSAPPPPASVAGTSSTGTTVTSTFGVNSISGGSVSTGLSSIHESSKGDKERERRKRREGSERKSQRGEDDTRSRSSEGSESLKDRQRGKGGCVTLA